MHCVDGDERVDEAEFRDQLLDRRDFIGFLIAIDMAEHEGRLGGEGAENVRGLTIVKTVETASQRLAVDRDLPATEGFDFFTVEQRRRVLAKRLLDRGDVELLQDPADCRVGWRLAPFQAEKFAQARQMHVNERVHIPVGIRSRQRGEDGEKHDMRQTIEFALGAARIFDLGQEIQERRKRFQGNPPNQGCRPMSQSFRCAGIPKPQTPSQIARPVASQTHPGPRHTAK